MATHRCGCQYDIVGIMRKVHFRGIHSYGERGSILSSPSKMMLWQLLVDNRLDCLFTRIIVFNQRMVILEVPLY